MLFKGLVKDFANIVIFSFPILLSCRIKMFYMSYFFCFAKQIINFAAKNG